MVGLVEHQLHDLVAPGSNSDRQARLSSLYMSAYQIHITKYDDNKIELQL